ncbi:LysR family transcriptional regulator, partial [Acinetobacter baumannii]|nr:LysR family transcriptional regulator [Acinetobacter baumannii]EKX9585757.1 LysR family transcriptional regulator [Acinetobacter baumannii]EME4832715.1 LysR family transcriptional regulator [Acinetobacter baumannii]
FAGCPLLGGTALPFDQKCEFACDKETGHEYTIRTLVEQHNIAEAYTLKT